MRNKVSLHLNNCLSTFLAEFFFHIVFNGFKLALNSTFSGIPTDDKTDLISTFGNFEA
jgi:hypothetical protein